VVIVQIVDLAVASEVLLVAVDAVMDAVVLDPNVVLKGQDPKADHGPSADQKVIVRPQVVDAGDQAARVLNRAVPSAHLVRERPSCKLEDALNLWVLRRDRQCSRAMVPRPEGRG
jgi:hypothetical protein